MIAQYKYLSSVWVFQNETVANKRTRYQRALGAGRISDSDYDERLSELAAEREALKRELDTAGAEHRAAERARQCRADARDLLGSFDVLATLPPSQANALVAAVLSKIVVTRRAVTDIHERE